ncbi:MAG: T9SS type A sorting domain-containing protein, partial [Flavobacteriales bacterium]|nr:T9SS type A sorting domain-containing protein [Flavobacteriales bacterium]
ITDASPTATDVLTGLNLPAGLLFIGNDLYIAEYGANKILKIDVTDASPIATDVVTTGIAGPFGMEVNGNDLYIAEFGGNKISKYSGIVTSINDETVNQGLTLFPNPSTDFLRIPGLSTEEMFKIYDITGKQVIEGVISNNEKINISSLCNGEYVLKLMNKKSILFVKN